MGGSARFTSYESRWVLSSRRTLILIAAIAVGALAAFAIFNYVSGIEDRAHEGTERREVVKITQTIPQGMTGTEAMELGYLDTDAAIAEEFLPPTAIVPTGVETILNKIAVAELAPNQVLVESMFVDPVNSQITNARRIQTGNVAITISVDNVRGVAGLIVPGDFVNMMAIPEGDCGSAQAAAGEEAENAATPEEIPTAVFCAPARMVYQGAQVLFVDRSPIPLPGEQTATNAADGTTQQAANTGLLTLSVPPQAAQIIASVGAGQWYLTLLPPDYRPAPLPPFDPTQPLLPGEDGAQLTPYGPEGFQEDETP